MTMMTKVKEMRLSFSDFRRVSLLKIVEECSCSFMKTYFKIFYKCTYHTARRCLLSFRPVVIHVMCNALTQLT